MPPQVAQALIRTELAPKSGGGKANGAASQGADTKDSAFNHGISIRGQAGPFVVMAQNFAPGTTAADIESAMTPVGGLVTSCRLLKTSPIVIAEIVFESREGAEKCHSPLRQANRESSLQPYLDPPLFRL